MEIWGKKWGIHMIKLVITDLDGTFLNSQNTFDSAYFRKVKQAMENKEIIFAACTGKQCERVEALFGELSKDVWILGDSATRIKYNGSYIYESLLPNAIGKEIITKLDEIASDYTIIACTPSAAYIKETTPEKEMYMVNGSYAVVKKLSDLQDIEEDFVKITVFDSKHRCFESVKELEGFEDRAYIVASEAAWIDISNYDVHKGTTVAELQKRLQTAKEETVAFGDGFNDIELFAQAGISFAMDNAFDQVKEKADFVTKSNDENGVLRTIEKLLMIQE
jgi:Cof subfamily protein (haloacid dehalogenase superfamily)